LAVLVVDEHLAALEGVKAVKAAGHVVSRDLV
jgi:hypothetical protein